MPRSQFPSSKLRYIRARLFNLARPSFWVTAIFLSVVGFVIKEYWSNPDFLRQGRQNSTPAQQTSGDSSLSEEDKAIAADIDNLPVLLNEGKDTIFPPRQDITQVAKEINRNRTVFNELVNRNRNAVAVPQPNSSTASSSTAVPRQNPFLTQAENLLQIGTLGFNPAINPTASNSSVPGTTATSSRVGILGNQINQNQTATTVNTPPVVNFTNSQNQANINQTNTGLQQSAFTQPIPVNNTSGINAINDATLPQINTIPQPIQTTISSSNSNNNNFVNQTLAPTTVPTPQTQFINPGVAYPQVSTTNTLPLNPYTNPVNTQTLPTTAVSPVNFPSNVTSTTPIVTNPYGYQTPQGMITTPNPGQPVNYVNMNPQQPVVRQRY